MSPATRWDGSASKRPSSSCSKARAMAFSRCRSGCRILPRRCGTKRFVKKRLTARTACDTLFQRALEAGIQDGALRSDLDAEAGADLLMCVWQGLRVEVGLYNVSEERAVRAVSLALALMAN